ncbi:MAG: HD family phosphohydrolase [Treponema sp.]
MSEYAIFSEFSLDDFKVGKVANRDIIANKDIEYIDEKATLEKRKEKRRTIGAIFDKNEYTDEMAYKNYEAFTQELFQMKEGVQNVDEFVLNMQQRYPSKFDVPTLEKLYRTPVLYNIITSSLSIYKRIIETGVLDEKKELLDLYDTTDATIIYSYDEKTEYRYVDFTSLVFLHTISGYENIDVETYIKSMLVAHPSSYDVVAFMILPFVNANVTYNKVETEKKVMEELEKVPNVVLKISKGEKIIERDFVIKEEDYNKLKEYQSTDSLVNMNLFIGYIIYIAACFALAIFLLSKEIIGEVIEVKYLLLLLLASTLVYIELVLLSHVSFISQGFSLVPFLPCVFFSILFYVLRNKRMAVVSSVVLSFSCLLASNFNLPLSMFAFFSSISGIAFTNITGRRLDLIKTACILAGVQPLIALSCLLIFPNTIGNIIFILLASSLNGFLSGIFLLGFLPIIEVILNTPTVFRLIEISDLNTPLMKKMLVAVSGTYSHSMMVATLAENACNAIGANALLARVGAYYHDIGKMDMGEYFIENQHDGINKHDGIPPRLSATVLRSHVQKSIEKARTLHLPQAVIDIMAEHHGNGLIAYFYNKAKESGENIDPIDFSYPGHKPQTKESAVVMLSDMIEAGCRSLSKHSVPSLTKFINNAFKNKIESGQLDESQLTFKDISTIKSTFIDILSGYYHSRIKYPNQKDEEDEKIETKKLPTKEGTENEKG